MIRRSQKHIGNRGGALIVLGIIWLLVAAQIPITPISRPGGRLLPYEHLPIWFRCALWALPGIAAFAGALWRNWDPFAWAALMVPVAERGLSYLGAWFFDLATGDYPTAGRGFLVYASLGALVYFCARGLDRAPNGGEPHEAPR